VAPVSSHQSPVTSHSHTFLLKLAAPFEIMSPAHACARSLTTWPHIAPAKNVYSACFARTQRAPALRLPCNRRRTGGNLLVFCTRYWDPYLTCKTPHSQKAGKDGPEARRVPDGRMQNSERGRRVDRGLQGAQFASAAGGVRCRFFSRKANHSSWSLGAPRTTPTSVSNMGNPAFN